MFKDQKEELARLEEELLKDQELYDPALPEEFEEDAAEVEDFADGFADYDIPAPEGWNTDTADEDLEELSREVYDTPRRRGNGLLGFTAFLLLLAAALGWLVMKQRGMLP